MKKNTKNTYGGIIAVIQTSNCCKPRTEIEIAFRNNEFIAREISENKLADKFIAKKEVSEFVKTKGKIKDLFFSDKYKINKAIEIITELQGIDFIVDEKHYIYDFFDFRVAKANVLLSHEYDKVFDDYQKFENSSGNLDSDFYEELNIDKIGAGSDQIIDEVTEELTD